MQKPIANVFTWPADDRQLLDSRRGSLVSWTTQGSRRALTKWAIPAARPSRPVWGPVQHDDIVRVEVDSPKANPKD
jgi:hypothetical protein